MTYPQDIWRGLRVRWRALLDRHAMERRLRQEVRFHLEMEERKAIAEGHSPAQARLKARRRFGTPLAWARPPEHNRLPTIGDR